MSDTHLTIEDHVAVLEICRPPANYFDEALIGELVATLERLDDDASCRAVVLCSEGKHFCAGADFGGTFASGRAETAARLYRRALALFRTRKPIIAAVQGAAVGGGLGLACVADFRVADADTRFVANFAGLGFHQGFGLSVTLPAIVGRQRAADLLLRSATVRGKEAHAIGLADRLAEPGGQRGTAVAWAREIAAAAPLAVASIRATLRADLADLVQAALDHELAEQTRLWETADSVEGIAASIERRAPSFAGR
ncbi:enoyl-CoA hydratase/isomerase family protein [Pseudonocardia broussonetiae]|uniref:Enoyl-CoA hydratase/isomerase family protein n=1 Tax=Pseudonocardia broussonetiae TaxID=2736640 RepID=A0A6M6JH78_9PSEU|nr:enoyl-CoA hydratase/isomerase family protein [Pseudonocardia broussonetiae]QJY46072.1 enoyl-CoA hydratase/isomerase family protein [Pseudonocardia broussonetiae]